MLVTSECKIMRSAGISSFGNCDRIVEDIPLREASRGRMSKMSMPCIFPMCSRRSRPVDWSRSVGMVPGLAPGGRRSSSTLISICQQEIVVSIMFREFQFEI
jgi:hypothetical protein